MTDARGIPREILPNGSGQTCQNSFSQRGEHGKTKASSSLIWMSTWLRLLTAFLFISLAATNSVLAEPFKLSLKISGVADLQDARVRVYVYTANGANQPGLTTQEFGPEVRNSLSQWDIRIEDLRFSDVTERGFYYADVIDRSGAIQRRVPLTYFDSGDLTTLRWLNRDARALKERDEQFKDSYPIYLPETGIFTDENSDFLLLVFRTLVTKGFVTENPHWTRLFDFFRGNVRYLGDGGSGNISRILAFLEGRYDQDKTNLFFLDFYLDFLSQLLTLDLGGRSVPGHENLEEYIIARISIVFSEQPTISLNGIARALQVLNERQKVDACFRISLSVVKTLSFTTDMYTNITRGSQSDLSLKRILKRVVDCTQKNYALDEQAGPDAGVGNLSGGVKYFAGKSEASRALLRDFFRVYNMAEPLFPRRNDRGDWKQIYDYYDLIRASGVIQGQDS